MRKAVISGVVVAIGLGVAVLSIILLRDDNASKASSTQSLRHVTLPPLPVGEPRRDQSQVSLAGVRAGEMVRNATVVFIGTAVDKGGSEVVLREPELPGREDLTAHRIRFSIERVFRGPRVDAIDLSTLDLAGEELDPFVIGKKYVVFAEPGTLGNEKAPRLVAVGYRQGAFLLEESDSTCPWVAKNKDGDVASCDDPLQEVPAVVMLWEGKGKSENE